MPAGEGGASAVTIARRLAAARRGRRLLPAGQRGERASVGGLPPEFAAGLVAADALVERECVGKRAPLLACLLEAERDGLPLESDTEAQRACQFPERQELPV